MQAMAAADTESGTEAGARLLALIRDGGKVDTSVSKRGQGQSRHTSPKTSPGGAANMILTGGAGGENKISYDRDFLFSCASSPICQEMPKALAAKIDEFPQMRRKMKTQFDHYRLFEHQPSIVDSLPLRPTAQIFTWDPNVGQWVPRARPQEV